MGIDYLSGIKAGDIIDLSRFEKKKKEINPEHYLACLKENLLKMAAENNEYFPDFLDNDGKISLSGREAESDKALTLAQEEGFSASSGKDLKTWRDATEKKSSNLTEIAITIMLHKILKKDFIVARASNYDDYNNGVDNVLVDKLSGEVVCGFDEVLSNIADDGGAKKEAKLEKIMAKGGARIKYGAKLENGKLVRSEVRNIPAFYMSLSKDELANLLESIKNNPSEIGLVEENIFNKLINSLEAQALNQDLNESLKEKTSLILKKLKEAISRDQKIAA
ncbi:MAG: hypothetical protein ACOYL8_00205 [Patescibacteria group bacterium]